MTTPHDDPATEPVTTQRESEQDVDPEADFLDEEWLEARRTSPVTKVLVGLVLVALGFLAGVSVGRGAADAASARSAAGPTSVRTAGGGGGGAAGSQGGGGSNGSGGGSAQGGAQSTGANAVNGTGGRSSASASATRSPSAGGATATAQAARNAGGAATSSPPDQAGRNVGAAVTTSAPSGNVVQPTPGNSGSSGMGTVTCDLMGTCPTTTTRTTAPTSSPMPGYDH